MTDCDILDVFRRYEYKSIATICVILNQSRASHGSKFPWSFSNTENLGEFVYTLPGEATGGARALVIIPLLLLSIHKF